MQNSLPALSIVIGAARSGKSALAERLVTGSGLAPVYVATAEAGDDSEMGARIAAHKARRGGNWREVEAGRNLAEALATAKEGEVVLIDCIMLWLTGVLLAGEPLDAAEEELFAALRRCPAPVVAVTGEVGAGIVPDNALARRFRDA
ncbi:MAG: bifunctional adenosylcobinamide kinase/adenosylcobinamide-phosphate guanylyltransferase, partial [Alphaproteobacteria bacterium]